MMEPEVALLASYRLGSIPSACGIGKSLHAPDAPDRLRAEDADVPGNTSGAAMPGHRRRDGLWNFAQPSSEGRAEAGKAGLPDHRAGKDRGHRPGATARKYQSG